MLIVLVIKMSAVSFELFAKSIELRIAGSFKSVEIFVIGHMNYSNFTLSPEQ